MKAVVLMATPCPKTLHGKGEKWIARIGDFLKERRWVLLKIPRCDIDGVGEGK